MSIIQALAMTVAEIPVFVYTTFGQVQRAEEAFPGGSWGFLSEGRLQRKKNLR